MFEKSHCIFFTCCLLSIAFFLSSCQSKTKQLLAKKWDCVKVENLAPVNKKFLPPEDSLVTAQLENALQNLSWQFNADDTYQCSTGGIVTVQGIYQLSDDGKALFLTSAGNNSNNYVIVTLTELELVLKGQTTGVPVVLHFREH